MADAPDPKAHVRFSGVDRDTNGLRITFDDRLVPLDRLGDELAVDPGRHHVWAHAVGRQGTTTQALQFDQDYDLLPGQTRVVAIQLQPITGPMGQMDCLVGAQTREEADRCVPHDTQTTLATKPPPSTGCACREVPVGDATAPLAAGVVIAIAALALLVRRARF